MTGLGKISLHSIYEIPVNKPFIMCYYSPGQPTVESKVYMIIEYAGTPFTEPIKIQGNMAADEKNEASDEKYLQELNRIFNCDDILNIKTISNLKSSFDGNTDNLNRPNLVRLKENDARIYKCLRTGEKGISYRTAIELQKSFKVKGRNRLNNFKPDIGGEEKGKKRLNSTEQDLDGEDIFLKNLYNLSEIAPKKGKTVTLTEEEINSGRQLNVDEENDDENYQENFTSDINSDNEVDPSWNSISREIKIEPMDIYECDIVKPTGHNEIAFCGTETGAKEKENKRVKSKDSLERVFEESMNAMDTDMNISYSNKDSSKMISNCTRKPSKIGSSKGRRKNTLKENPDGISQCVNDAINYNQLTTPGCLSNNLANMECPMKPDLLSASVDFEESSSKRFSRRISDQKDRNVSSHSHSNHSFKDENNIDDKCQEDDDEPDPYMDETDEENECSVKEDPDYVPSIKKDRKKLAKFDAHGKRKADKNRQSFQTPVSKKVKNSPSEENLLIPDAPKQTCAKLENQTSFLKQLKVNSSADCSFLLEETRKASVKLQKPSPVHEKMENNSSTESVPLPVEPEDSTLVLKNHISIEKTSVSEKPKRIMVKLEDYQNKYYIEDLVSLHRMDRGKSDSEKTIQVMVCAECKKFKTEDQTQMEIHIEQHVNGELTCKKCQFIGKSLKEMSMHESGVHKKHIKNHTCFLCKEKFKFLQNYQDHVTQEHNLLPWVCNHCSTIENPVMFESRNSYREHFIEKHKDLLLQCVHCGFYFANKKVLLRHSCNVKNQDRKTPCDICGKLLASAMSVKLHKNAVHFNIRAYPCSQCNYTAKSSLVLKNHVQAKHRGIRPYKCDECNFSSVKASQLASHKRTHTGQRPYKCDKCPYTAAWNVQLKDHKKLHDSSLGQECMFCCVVVRKGAAYAKHIKKEHGLDEY